MSMVWCKVVIGAIILTSHSSCTTLNSSLRHLLAFDACRADAGVRGRFTVPDGLADPSIELEQCGSWPGNETTLQRIRQVLAAAIGPLNVQNFAGVSSREVDTDSQQSYLQRFATAAATSLTSNCSQHAEAQSGTQPSPTVCSASGAREDEEDVLAERAVLEGLAAASATAKPDSGDDKKADHVALASVTHWMRENEKKLEWGLEHDVARQQCLAEGELKGYECRTFTYGSTYFHSWLRVMRFPAVADALTKAAAGDNEVVVLGSSLGWQTIWAALTFGVRSVGYELMDHRISASRAAVDSVHNRLVEFRHLDATKSNLTRAAVVYLTDLIWEDYLCGLVANHVKKSLQQSPGGGEGVVVISNKYSSWSKAKFKHLGSLQVPVTWMEKQEFHFWALKAAGARR